MKATTDAQRGGGSQADLRPDEAIEEAPARKQIYLRTVYPLNPGIPHFIDVPGGWSV